MKVRIYFLILALFLSGCSAYQKYNGQRAYYPCSIDIQCSTMISNIGSMLDYGVHKIGNDNYILTGKLNSSNKLNDNTLRGTLVFFLTKDSIIVDNVTVAANSMKNAEFSRKFKTEEDFNGVTFATAQWWVHN